MALVPSGRRRIMVAQSMPNPMAEQAGELDMQGVSSPDQLMPPEEEQNPLEDPAGELQNEVEEVQMDQEVQSEGDNNVRQTVFDFLVTLGYPPRRLQEFKSKFVSETGSPDSGTQVTIVIPDEIYGKNTPIPRDKIKEIVQLIEQKNGLSFKTYERKDEKLTLNFMSADAAQQQALEDSGPGDILDQVYGTPGGNKKAASTIQEMIKESKDQQARLLRTVLGERELK